jgi:hypothetical protein
MGNGPSQPAPAPAPAPAPYVPPTTSKFERPKNSTNLALSVKNSSSCDTCKIILDPTLSSSSVTLTRDILGKIPASQKAPSDNWTWDRFVIFQNGVPTLFESNADIDLRCGSRCTYKRADPSAFGQTKIKATGCGEETDVGPDGTVVLRLGSAGANRSNVLCHFKDDKIAWEADQKLASKRSQTKTSDKMVRIWNPSDDPTDPDGSIALNYKNYGALTKLHIKPSIPFKVEFNPY